MGGIIMRASVVSLLTAICMCTSGGTDAATGDEITLFSGDGQAQSYVALSDGLTVYLWDGTPAAYLISRSQGGFDVYGFNGFHLGWFERGVVWDHDGDAACAVKEVLQSTRLEPLRSLKQLKPLKSLKQLAPLRPLLSKRFGVMPCALLLASGAE